MRKMNEKIIKVEEEVRVGDVILEEGDRIKILSEQRELEVGYWYTVVDEDDMPFRIDDGESFRIDEFNGNDVEIVIDPDDYDEVDFDSLNRAYQKGAFKRDSKYPY